MQPTRHDPTQHVWRDAAVPGRGGRAVLAVLRSPLHRLMSRRLLGIAYVGARTGLRRTRRMYVARRRTKPAEGDVFVAIDPSG